MQWGGSGDVLKTLELEARVTGNSSGYWDARSESLAWQGRTHATAGEDIVSLAAAFETHFSDHQINISQSA